VEESEKGLVREAGRWGFFRVIWIGLAVVMLYVFSIGPAVKMACRSTTIDRSLVIYTPLEYVAYYSPTASRFLKWYIEDLWKAKGATGL